MANPPRPICCVLNGGKYDCKIFFVQKIGCPVIIVGSKPSPVRVPPEVVYEAEVREPVASKREVKYLLFEFDRYVLVAHFKPA